jgi:hypothetical protein
MTKIALFLRLNNFIQPLGQLRDDGLYVADLMNPPASHTTSLLPSFKSAAVALAWTWTCDVFGLVEARSCPRPDHVRGQIMSEARSCPWPDHVRGQFTVTADSWSRSGRVAVHVRGQGVAIVWPFCGHFVDTESFTDEGVGRALG